MNMKDLPATGMVNFIKACLAIMTISGFSRSVRQTLGCKTVVFFANTSDSQYSNERSGASLKRARENGERR